jgi:predicted branched-subunit amino acid permease
LPISIATAGEALLNEEFFMISSWALHRAGVDKSHETGRGGVIMVALIIGVMAVSVGLAVVYTAFMYTAVHAGRR